MAFNPINFLQAPINQNTSMSNFVQNLLGGYKAAREPTRIAQEEERNRMANEMADINLQYLPEEKKLQLAFQQMKNQFLPQQAQADLALTNAQREKALRPPQEKLTELENLINGFRRVQQVYPQDSPEYKFAQQYLQRKANGSQGIEIVDPTTGNPMVRIGGNGRPSSNDMFQSGNEIVQPLTSAAKTQTQKKILAGENLERYLTKALPLGEYLNPGKKFTTDVAGLSNKYLGTNFESPSLRAYAQSSLETSVEPLMLELGLNVTDKSKEHVQKIITPQEGESGQGWVRRVTKQLEDYRENQRSATKAAFGGVRMNTGESNRPPAGAIVRKYNPATGGFS